MTRQIVFWMLAVQTAVGAVMTVTMRNVVRAALSLVVAMTGVAGVFLLFGAEFVGLVQILVYVGAIVVLFLFGIMLTQARPGVCVVDNNHRWLAALVSAGVFAVLAAGIITAFGDKKLKLDVAFPTRELGGQLFTTWILPFEAVSMLLLAALIGSIVLARKD